MHAIVPGVQQADAEVAFATDNLSRTRDLAERSLASQAQLQEAERSLAVAEARLTEAQAGLQQAELDLQRTEITAPFAAVIDSKDVELGQFVNRAQNVAVLYGADEVEVRVPLAIRQLGYLDIPLGLRGELAAQSAPAVEVTGMYGGVQHQWQGRLVRIEAAIDQESNSVQSIIRVRQPERSAKDEWSSEIPLPIGLYVQAEISGRQVDDIVHAAQECHQE